MDAGTVIIAASVVFISASFLFMIFRFATKQLTFEDVLREQRLQAANEERRLKLLRKAEKEQYGQKKKVKKKSDKAKLKINKTEVNNNEGPLNREENQFGEQSSLRSSIFDSPPTIEVNTKNVTSPVLQDQPTYDSHYPETDNIKMHKKFDKGASKPRATGNESSKEENKTKQGLNKEDRANRKQKGGQITGHLKDNPAEIDLKKDQTGANQHMLNYSQHETIIDDKAKSDVVLSQKGKKSKKESSPEKPVTASDNVNKTKPSHSDKEKGKLASESKQSKDDSGKHKREEASDKQSQELSQKTVESKNKGKKVGSVQETDQDAYTAKEPKDSDARVRSVQKGKNKSSTIEQPIQSSENVKSIENSDDTVSRRKKKKASLSTNTLEHVDGDKPKLKDVQSSKEDISKTKRLDSPSNGVKSLNNSKVKVKVSEGPDTPGQPSTLLPNRNKPQSCKTLSEVQMSLDLLLEGVNYSQLSETDIHTIVDKLYGKIGLSPVPVASKKKGDATTALRKQLEEKEKALKEAQSVASAANNRLQESKKEVSQGIVKVAQLEKSYMEKLSTHTQEVQALQRRMQQSQDSHVMEVMTLNQKHGCLIQEMKEENGRLKDSLVQAQASVQSKDMDSLKQQVQILHQEMNKNAIKLNATEREKKCLEETVESKAKSEAAMKSHLEEVLHNLGIAEGANNKLVQDLSRSSNEATSMQKECNSLRHRIQEQEKSISDFDSIMKSKNTQLKVADDNQYNLNGTISSLQERLKCSEDNCEELNIKLQEVMSENDLLIRQLKAGVERKSGEGEEAPVSSGDGGTSKVIDRQDFEEQDIRLFEKVTQLNELQDEFTATVNEKERTIVQLNEKLKISKQSLDALANDLENQKKKNNELREKNWKAVSALQEAEKSALLKQNEALKNIEETHKCNLSHCENEYSSSLHRIFPDLSATTNQRSYFQSYGDWLKHFEEKAIEYLAHLSQRNVQLQLSESEVCDANRRLRELEMKLAESDDKLAETEHHLCRANRIAQESQAKVQEAESHLSELDNKNDSISILNKQLTNYESHISGLETQISDYRNVLLETEDKFKTLEENIDVEERKWREKIEQSESNLEKVTSELSSVKRQLLQISEQEETNMKKQIKALQEELQSSKENYFSKELELNESQKGMIELQEALDMATQSSEIQELKDKVEELKHCLEEEAVKSKKLGSEVIKLKSIVKIGHDALQQEQNLVKQLQEENSSLVQLKEKLEDEKKQGQSSTHLSSNKMTNSSSNITTDV